MNSKKRFACVLFSIIFLLRVLTLSPAAEVKVYRSVTTEKKQIALTFDDGPHPSLTPKILAILTKYGVRATFFMVGQNVLNYPSAAKQVIDAGHEVGNHTFTHPHLAGLNEHAIMEEIGKCEDALEELSEYRPHLLRTPQGAMTANLEKCLSDDDYILVLWSLDTRDWDNNRQMSTEKAKQIILENVHNGEVMLLHPTSSTNAAILQDVIRTLKEQGYRFGTLDELTGEGTNE